VEATDRDLGVHSDLHYRLSAQSDHTDLFTVDPDTGRIYIRSALDYERSTRYHLTVMAYDGVARHQLEDGGQKTILDSANVSAANKVHVCAANTVDQCISILCP